MSTQRRRLACSHRRDVPFPNYNLSPESKYPTAIEENYAVLKWVSEQGASSGLDARRIAVAGDNVGGNMAAALTLMAMQRRGRAIGQQLLFYPVTDASF